MAGAALILSSAWGVADSLTEDGTEDVGGDTTGDAALDLAHLTSCNSKFALGMGLELEQQLAQTTEVKNFTNEDKESYPSDCMFVVDEDELCPKFSIFPLTERQCSNFPQTQPPTPSLMRLPRPNAPSFP